MAATVGCTVEAACVLNVDCVNTFIVTGLWEVLSLHSPYVN